MQQTTKSQPVSPKRNERYDLWLCPSCEVEVTEVDLSIRECTCCGQKLRKP